LFLNIIVICYTRLIDVSHIDALAVTALSHIILDVSFQDAKKRSLLDIPENRDDVFKYILGAPRLLNAVKQGKVQIVLF
jgi:protein CMS1